MLRSISECCPNLIVLDLNNNNRVTGDSLYYLVPTMTNPGCTKLEKLYIQDCSVDPYDVANVILKLPTLTLIGYKEVGSALIIMNRWLNEESRHPGLKLTHFDNSESLLTKTDGRILKLLNSLAPDICNLKVRLNDDDSGCLANFKKLRLLEVRCFTRRGK